MAAIKKLTDGVDWEKVAPRGGFLDGAAHRTPSRTIPSSTSQ